MADIKDGSFLKIPVVKGSKKSKAWKFIEVDSARVGLNTLQLYQKTKKPGTNIPSYLPMCGSCFNGRLGVNTSGVDELIDDIFNTWESSLISYGEDGQAIWEKIRTIDFKAFSLLLVSGKVAEAEILLSEILYELLSLTCDLAQKCQEGRSLKANTEQLSEYFVQKELREDSLLLNWSVAAEDINRYVQLITDLKKEIETKAEIIRNKRAKLLSFFDDRGKDLGVIEGDDENVGFLIYAHRLSIEPSLENEDRYLEELGKVEKIIERYNDLQQKIIDFQKDDDADFKNWFLSASGKIKKYKVGFASAINKMLEFKKGFENSENVFRPCDITEGATAGLISREDYEAAERILIDANWSPMAVEKKLSAKINANLALLNDKPDFPERIESAVSKAKTAISVYQESKFKETETTVQIDDSIDAKRVNPVVESDAVSMDKSVCKSRAEELYEIIIAIAKVLTCNHYFAASSTIISMLNITRIMGLCTDDEVVQYSSYIRTAFVYKRGAREIVENGKRVIPRWKESSAVWIYYQQKKDVKKKRLKLSKSQAAQAEEFMEKYDLSVALIKKAHARRKEEVMSRYNKK